jgi:hypothetical protein
MLERMTPCILFEMKLEFISVCGYVTLRITGVGHIKSHVNPGNAITCANRFVM